MKRQIIATYLDKEQLAELEHIKQHHGLSANADTLRMLIRKEYNRIQQQDGDAEQETNND